MDVRYVVYGLDLRCSFPLPGMRAASADRPAAPDSQDLPALAVELVEPADLEGAWSGCVGQPVWTGRLGDGCTLSLQRGARDDLLFSYGERACFRLDATRARLECAPQRPGLDWQQVLLGRVLPNVAILRGYEALHASAVSSPAGVVAILAPSGTGKTTLALELLRRGWSLFADDVLVLGEDREPRQVRAYPGTPHMNVAASSPVTPTGELGATLGILAGERWVAVERLAPTTAPVRVICMLERGPGLPLAARELPASPLPLAPYMLGLEDSAERERRRFARYADLMGDATLVQLTCGSDDHPGKLAEEIERLVSERPALSLGGTG